MFRSQASNVVTATPQQIIPFPLGVVSVNSVASQSVQLHIPGGAATYQGHAWNQIEVEVFETAHPTVIVDTTDYAITNNDGSNIGPMDIDVIHLTDGVEYGFRCYAVADN